MSRRSRTLASLAAGSLAAVGLAGSSHGASTGARFTVELVPQLVVPEPRHVPSGTRGTLESEALHSRHVNRHLVSWRFDLRLSGTTSGVTGVDLRIAGPGRVGPLLARLCGRQRALPRCGPRVQGFVHGGSGSALVLPGLGTFIGDPRDSLRLHGAYVVVRTHLNPRGELRGDILPSLLLSRGATSARLHLRPHSHSVPKTASGSFEATIDEGVLTYRLSFSRLSSPARVAVLRLARPPADGSVTPVIRLCAGCGSPVEGAFYGKLARLVRTHGGRVVIGTERHPLVPGELSGRLTPAMFRRVSP